MRRYRVRKILHWWVVYVVNENHPYGWRPITEFYTWQHAINFALNGGYRP